FELDMQHNARNNVSGGISFDMRFVSLRELEFWIPSLRKKMGQRGRDRELLRQTDALQDRITGHQEGQRQACVKVRLWLRTKGQATKPICSCKTEFDLPIPFRSRPQVCLLLGDPKRRSSQTQISAVLAVSF